MSQQTEKAFDTERLMSDEFHSAGRAYAEKLREIAEFRERVATKRLESDGTLADLRRQFDVVATEVGLERDLKERASLIKKKQALAAAIEEAEAIVRADFDNVITDKLKAIEAFRKAAYLESGRFQQAIQKQAAELRLQQQEIDLKIRRVLGMRIGVHPCALNGEVQSLLRRIGRPDG